MPAFTRHALECKARAIQYAWQISSAKWGQRWHVCHKHHVLFSLWLIMLL